MKVELSLYAHGLKNVAGPFQRSDPFAVVTNMSTERGKPPVALGKTEVIENTANPQWVKVFMIDYELGNPVSLAVSVFDAVKSGENKPMGSALFDLGELLGARGNTKAKKLKSGGTLFATVRPSQGSGLLRLKMKGIKLKNVEGMLSKSDPFYELSRKIDSAGALTWDNVYRSPFVKNNLNPEWDTAVLELSTLCGGNLDLPILVSIYDHESSGKHVSMGQFETTVNGLVAASTNGSEDMGKAMKVTSKGKPTGHVVVLKAEVAGVEEEVSNRMANLSVAPAPAVAAAAIPSHRPTFVDYVSGGCEIRVMVAIDFTGSNGDPRQPGTLHYLHAEGAPKNDYEKAISAIVGILAKYDSDQKFVVVGFGAKYNGVVNHCFPCGPTEEVHGVDGVLKAYRSVFQTGLILSSPTVFTEVMQTAAAHATSADEAAKREGKQAYTILLIVTDGAVSDVQATAKVLEQISAAPLSTVIVGVGNADFSAMQFLDDGSKPGQRDIAQFVAFNQHSTSSVDLSSATLKEIPDQLVGYFQSRGIPPLPPVVPIEKDIVVEDEDEIDLTVDVLEHDIVVSGTGKQAEW